MTPFTIPPRPDTFTARDFRLRLSGDFALDAGEVESLPADLAWEGDAVHATFVAQVEGEGWRGVRVSGLIGVHRTTSDEHAAAVAAGVAAGAGSLHYVIHFEPGVVEVERLDDHWEQTRAVAARMLEGYPSRLYFWAQYPRDTVRFALNTPIPLGAAEVPGFSEIRGVRLAMMDSENADVELYSLVLDRRDSLPTVQAETAVEIALGRDAVADALSRALEIVGLATFPSSKAGIKG